MIRRVLRATMVLVAVLPIGALAEQSPANAATDASTECETHGSYCIGSADTNLYTHVSERNPGRSLLVVPTGGAATTFFIEFAPFDGSKCLAAKNDNHGVDIRPCDSPYAEWFLPLDKDGVSRDLQNFFGRYLTGHNNGGDYTLEEKGIAGGRQAFK